MIMMGLSYRFVFTTISSAGKATIRMSRRSAPSLPLILPLAERIARG
jgi:hypothetical protein